MLSAAPAAGPPEPSMKTAERDSHSFWSKCVAASDQYTFVPTNGTESRSVTYRSGDTFFVNGTTSQMAAFESSASSGDSMRRQSVWIRAACRR